MRPNTSIWRRIGGRLHMLLAGKRPRVEPSHVRRVHHADRIWQEGKGR